jgi:hypothetical protein
LDSYWFSVKVVNLIDVARLNAFESASVDGSHTFTISPTGSVHVSVHGEIVGVKVLDLGSPTVATAYVKITDAKVTGATGTFFDKNGSGAISGATPAFYPVRMYAVDPVGQNIGSPGGGICSFPAVGDMTITCGSLGSPVTFSGVEVYIKR